MCFGTQSQDMTLHPPSCDPKRTTLFHHMIVHLMSTTTSTRQTISSGGSLPITSFPLLSIMATLSPLFHDSNLPHFCLGMRTSLDLGSVGRFHGRYSSFIVNCILN